jgi:Uma2 family endonuclease
MNYPHSYPSASPPNPDVITAEQLLLMPDGDHFELVGGKLVEKNVGFESSWIGSVLLTELMIYCRTHKLGWVVGNDPGFRCYPEDSNKVRKPDIAFVSFSRLPGGKAPSGYSVVPPNLVVEVVSPNDMATDVDEKVSEYLAAGVECVWIVAPQARHVRVYYPDRGLILNENDELSGDPIIPGFRCSLKELFTPPTP